MTVENNPKWTEWSAAFDTLVNAAQKLKAFKQGQGMSPAYMAAKQAHALALATYNKISNEIE